MAPCQLMESYQRHEKQCVLIDNEINKCTVFGYELSQKECLDLYHFFCICNSLFSISVPTVVTAFADNTVFFRR